MKPLKTALLIVVITLAHNSYAKFTYEKDSIKWLAAILVGEIAYYGGNCKTSSPPKHRKLQMKVIGDAFANSEGNAFSQTLEVMSTFEFEFGGMISKTNGCSATRERLDSLADSAGITGNEPPQYLPPEEQDEIIDFISNLFNKVIK